ncbi:hypothetical protein Q3G72_016262 [Acer saccharum]|nr:hypothetical protein Q3G72_016262 [Acer saccharum]
MEIFGQSTSSFSQIHLVVVDVALHFTKYVALGTMLRFAPKESATSYFHFYDFVIAVPTCRSSSEKSASYYCEVYVAELIALIRISPPEDCDLVSSNL